ncbi:hypothetical protein M673_10660 [Aureimonas sp. AU20]|nr:hypothetical protein M673_10660 [Aureimonas sp. AU20]
MKARPIANSASGSVSPAARSCLRHRRTALVQTPARRERGAVSIAFIASASAPIEIVSTDMRDLASNWRWGFCGPRFRVEEIELLWTSGDDAKCRAALLSLRCFPLTSRAKNVRRCCRRAHEVEELAVEIYGQHLAE